MRSLIADMNRTHGVTVILTTHLMEEAEELCGQIGLLREGVLVAHQPTGALTQSLGLAWPIVVTARPPRPPDPAVTASLHSLPGVARVEVVCPTGPELIVLRVESLDLRATTPELLAWLRGKRWRLVSMQATPVTLDDVFSALMRKT